jgi:hypothetical protein
MVLWRKNHMSQLHDLINYFTKISLAGIVTPAPECSRAPVDDPRKIRVLGVEPSNKLGDINEDD